MKIRQPSMMVASCAPTRLLMWVSAQRPKAALPPALLIRATITPRMTRNRKIPAVPSTAEMIPVLTTWSTAAGAEVSVYVYIESGVGYGDTDPAIVDKLEDIYNNMEFAYPGWEIDMQDNSGLESIDYVYSKQNKLEALTKTMELTDDLFWRVGWWDYKKVEIGKFGEQKPYTVSTRPSGKTNIRIISEP